MPITNLKNITMVKGANSGAVQAVILETNGAGVGTGDGYVLPFHEDSEHTIDVPTEDIAFEDKNISKKIDGVRTDTITLTFNQKDGKTLKDLEGASGKNYLYLKQLNNYADADGKYGYRLAFGTASKSQSITGASNTWTWTFNPQTPSSPITVNLTSFSGITGADFLGTLTGNVTLTDAQETILV